MLCNFVCYVIWGGAFPGYALTHQIPPPSAPLVKSNCLELLLNVECFFCILMCLQIEVWGTKYLYKFKQCYYIIYLFYLLCQTKFIPIYENLPPFFPWSYTKEQKKRFWCFVIQDVGEAWIKNYLGGTNNLLIWGDGDGWRKDRK